MHPPAYSELQQLLGLAVTLEGKRCQVIEILEDGPSVVVECLDLEPGVQPNQFGDGHRRAPRHITIPLCSPSEPERLDPRFQLIWSNLI